MSATLPWACPCPEAGAGAMAGEGGGGGGVVSVEGARQEYVALGTAALAEESCLVEGQVCHMRKLSKRLVFVDLRQLGSTSAVYAGQPKLEVMLKEAQVGAEQMGELRRTIKLGDEVRVAGRIERCARQGDLVLLATDVCVVRKWAQTNPGCSFTPDPIGAAKPIKRQRVDTDASNPGDEAAPAFLAEQPGSTVEVGVGAGLCKFFVNQGICKRDNCPYRHVAADRLAETRSAWVAGRKASRLDAARLDGDPHENESKKDKAARASLFADFLVAEYGEAMLNSGSGVVDVAGGRGDLSFELHCRRGIRTTLIEPRPQKLTKAQRKYFKAQRRKQVPPPPLQQQQGQQGQSKGQEQEGTGRGVSTDAAAATAAAAAGRARAQAEAAQMPRQFRCFFGPHLLADGNPNAGSTEHCGINVAALQTPQDSTAVVTAAELPALTTEEAAELRTLLLSCSVVVGMHPDEATEPLVDFAIQLKKPWAVVPCCVFAHQFPGRVLKLPRSESVSPSEKSEVASGDGSRGSDSRTQSAGQAQGSAGKPVQSYEDFVTYLKQKCPEARTLFLPFHGKNQVVYMPAPAASCDGAA
eukprot:COSAG02_NODE_308_length_25072_cov_20.906925_16_plen_583_part_00